MRRAESRRMLEPRRRRPGSPAERDDLARAVAELVGTLTAARDLAAGGAIGAELTDLLDRARRELDVADEKLLVLDRLRERSMFRRATRIRERIDRLQHSVTRRAKSRGGG